MKHSAKHCVRCIKHSSKLSLRAARISRAPVLAILAAAAMIGCSRDDALSKFLLPGGGSAPSVILTYPSQGQTGVSPEDRPWVLFNMPMDMQKTQSAFRLSSGSGQSAGSFAWEGTKLVFTPLGGLAGTSEFTMTVGRDAENTAGVDLESEVNIRFYAQADSTRPSFVSSNPASGSAGVSASGDIVLTFSEAMDVTKAQSAISITPSSLVSYLQGSNRSEIILRPGSALSNGLYSVHISTGMTDLSGNALDQNYTISFTVGNDAAAPGITGVAAGAVTLQNHIDTHGVLRTDSIVITFTEPMNRIATEAAVSLSPAKAGTKTWDGASQVLTLTFTGGLDPEELYTLSIDTSASDATGNALLSAHSYPFYTDAVTRPEVLTVRQALVAPAFQGRVDNAAGSGAFSAALSDYDALDLAHQIDELPAVGSSDFVIHLTVQFDRANMVRTSLVSNTSITRILDPGAGNLAVYGIDLAGDTMTVKLYGSPFPGGTGTPVYRLTVGQAARDTNGNTLGTDYNLYLVF